MPTRSGPPPAPACSSHVLRALLSIAAYFVSGIVITNYNRWLLHTRKFKFPIFLIMISSFANWLLCLLVIFVFRRREVVERDPNWVTRIPTLKVVFVVLPIGVFFSLDVTMTNAAFVTLSVALTEVIKSNIPTLVLVAHFMTGKERFSLAKMAVVALLCVGAGLTARGDMTFRLVGFIFAALAAASGACKLLLMEHALQGRSKLSPLLGMFYVGLVSSVALVVPFVMFEAHRLEHSSFFHADVRTTLLELAVAVVLAFLLNMSSLFVVATTSALTLCVVGVVRLVAIIGVSAIVMDDVKLTPSNETGVFLAIMGVSLYNYLRYREKHGEGGVLLDYEDEDEELHTLLDPDVDAAYMDRGDIVGHGSERMSKIEMEDVGPELDFDF